MGHWSTQFTGHNYLHPEGPDPCIYCLSAASIPQPNVHLAIADQRNTYNFNYQPEHHDGALFYGMTQYSGSQHQHPVAHIDSAVAAPFGPYPYMAPPPCIRDIPILVNHGARDQLSFASTHGIVGIPTVSYGGNFACIDGIRGSFSGKNAEGVLESYRYHNALTGPSSSVGPTTAWPVERDVASVNGTSFLPPECGGNEPGTSIVENESHRSVRNRFGMILPESVLGNNGNHLIRGSNAEGVPVNYQCHNASAGSSSSVLPVTARPAELGVASVNHTYVLPPEHAGNEPSTSTMEDESHRSARDIMILPESVQANNGSHLIQGKNAEGIPVNYQYHNGSAGSSSSVVPMAARPAEPEVVSVNGTYFLPPQYGGNEPRTSVVENESHRSARNGSDMILPRSVLANNSSHLIQGSYVNLPVQVPGSFLWTHASSIPYMPANVNGACGEAENVGIQGYHVTTGSGSASSFPHLSIPQGHPNLHYVPLPMQGIRGYNINFPSQLATSSNRISTFANTNSNLYQGTAGMEQTLLAHVPPTGFQLYWPRQREVILDSYTRHQNLPNIGLLPEQKMTTIGIPGYRQAGILIDQHRDMRLDVDRMTYEELLALGEQIGIVGTGISEEDIQNSMKTRTFSLLASCLKQQEAEQVDQQSNFCVICQTEFENQENIGILDCGHEYHGGCIKKWLLIKNTCPICKSTALSVKK